MNHTSTPFFTFQIINNCCVANLLTSEMGQELLVAERPMHATVATTAATFLLFHGNGSLVP